MRWAAVVALLVLVSAPAGAQDTPLTLPAASEMLVRRNLAVEAARHRVTVAAAERIAARLLPRPTVTLSADNVNLGGPQPSNQLNEYGFTVFQPLELGNRRGLRAELAERTVAVAETELSAALRRQLYDMRRTYYETLLATVLVEVARDNRSAYERLVEVNTVRFDEGYLAESELFKVRLERTRYENALLSAQLSRRQSAVRLLELLGDSRFELAATLELADSLEPRAVPLDIEALRSAALQQNPEVVVALAEVERAGTKARFERSVASGEVIPYLGYRRVGDNNTVQAGVTVPLPFGNRNQSGIARAEAQMRVAESNLGLARNRAMADLEAAYAAYEAARAQAAVYAEGLLRQATQLRDIASKAYAEGVWDLGALLEAQRTYGDLRTAHARALFDYHVSILQLELASGVDILK